MKINQSTQLKNMLNALRVPGVNIVSGEDGIIFAGKHVAGVLNRQSKNSYNLFAISSNENIALLKKEFTSIGAAIDFCTGLIMIDRKLN